MSEGFSREELTAAAAQQAKVAPSKEEILAAINTVPPENGEDGSQVAIYCAVEKLFVDRGL